MGASRKETFAEAGYPKHEAACGAGNTRRLHLRNNEKFAGGMEYCDTHFTRLTRKQEPSHMQEIKHLRERKKTAS